MNNPLRRRTDRRTPSAPAPRPAATPAPDTAYLYDSGNTFYGDSGSSPAPCSDNSTSSGGGSYDSGSSSYDSGGSSSSCDSGGGSF